MIFRDNKTGQIFPTIQDAVENFKCPGPCDSHCTLFDIIEIRPDTNAHKCHPAYTTTHTDEIAKLIDCTPIYIREERPVTPTVKYAVIAIVERELENVSVYADKQVALQMANMLLTEHMKRHGTNPDDADIKSELGTEWCYANESTWQARSNYDPNIDVYIIEIGA